MVDPRGGWSQSPVPANQRNASVGKAAAILRIAAAHPDGLSVSALARAAGIPRATTLRMVDALEAEGLVARLRDRDAVLLGVAVLALADAVRPERLLLEAARRPLETLVREVGEAGTLSVTRGGTITCVLEIAGPRLIGPSGWLGRSWGVHATASGRLVLAAMPPATLDAYLGEPLPAVTEATVTDPGVIRSEVAAARTQGWAASVDELEIGLTSIAAAVGDTGAYVGLSGPTSRLQQRDLGTLGDAARTCADAIAAVVPGIR